MNLLYANDTPGAYPDSWYAATATPLSSFPALKGADRADLCVIGAGITGLSAALHAARSGLSVILLDAQRVGFGASGRNGGQVGSGFNIGQQALEKELGKHDAKALWQMAEAAKSLTRDFCAIHAPDARIAPGIAHAAWHASEVSQDHAKAEHLAAHYDYTCIDALDRPAIQSLIGAPHYKGGILDHGAFHLHPLRYVFGLARACVAAGVRIHETSAVHHIDHAAPAKVQTAQGHVLADQVIVAVNGYGTALTRPTTRRIMPINNFIVATEPLGGQSSSILSQNIAVADSKFVVNYFRMTEDNRLLFGGGESYGYRFPKDIATKVRRPMQTVFPQLEGVKIDYAWGGTLAITTTRLPYITAIAPHIWAAGGYSGHGVALAGLVGQILAQGAQIQTDACALLTRLPTQNFPGGGALRSPLLALAMTWFALRDRIGL